MRQSNLIAFWLGIIANVFWGTTFVASFWTLQYWEPSTSSFLRFSIATLMMLIIGMIFRKQDMRLPKDSSEIVLILLVGLSGFGLLYPLQLEGLKSITTSMSAVVMLTSPLFLIILGVLILNEKVSILKVLSVILGSIGGGIVLFSQNANKLYYAPGSISWGFILTLLASFCLALSAIVSRKLLKSMSIFGVTFWGMAVGTIIMGVIMILDEGVNNIGNLKSWLSLAYLAIFASVACFFLWNKALSIAETKTVATTMHIKTPVAIMCGILLNQESPTIGFFVGTTVVIVAIIISYNKND